jgi:predicted N-acetyltransferase YhbS
MKAAKAMGYGSAIVLGHPKCYLRFGFVPAAIKMEYQGSV